MKIPFNLYDFLGYALPGFVVIIIAVILINPESPLERSLPTSISQMIFYVLACYLVGLAVHGFTDWLFATLSKKWEPLKRYYSDQGTFERGLFDPKSREDPTDFVPYSDHFVGKLKTQIEKIFDVKVEEGNQVDDQKYMEIFEFCRSAVIERSPAHYSRAFVLLSLYNSARLLGGIFLLAAVGFLARIFVPQQHFEWTWIAVYILIFSLPWIETKGEKLNDCPKKESEKCCTKVLGSAYWIGGGFWAVMARLWINAHIPQNEIGGFKILFWGYCVSTALCPIFFYLYNLFRRYYRNSIIYGFYEYAVTREKNTEKSNAT